MVNRTLITNKPTRPLVAPSILSADFGRMADQCKDVLDAGADLLHVDVMDGHFVPNLTMGPDMCRGIRRHLPDVYLDVHLMVERPDIFAPMFADAGANLISFHLEVCQDIGASGSGGGGVEGGGNVDGVALIQTIHDLGMHAGMAINPNTPPDGLEPYFPNLDLVLIMSVHPGRSGQAFIPDVLPKAQWVRDRIAPATRLEMDGGLNPQTVPDAIAAGVDLIVAASAIFGSDDRPEVIRRLHNPGAPQEAK